jgi:hypothetical protein
MGFCKIGIGLSLIILRELTHKYNLVSFLSYHIIVAYDISHVMQQR